MAWAAPDDGLMLKARPGVFCAGEMLDWEAPTGGDLLTACCATGRWPCAWKALGIGVQFSHKLAAADIGARPIR